MLKKSRIFLVLKSNDKKLVSLFFFIIILNVFIAFNKSFALTSDQILKDKGIIALMYHRFNENKYPSTNIQIDIFKKQLEEIEKRNIEFIDLEKFEKLFKVEKNKKYLLLTIDDAFTSFYKYAWPILKGRNIPFILFVNTREVGSSGYMSWEQIREIQNSNIGKIGNHSHSHEYMVDWDSDEILKDINLAIKNFEKNLGYSPKIFSYPFGEYSNNFKDIVKKLNFNFAFGQHSGVISIVSNNLELPRFPINEKYGDMKRFANLLNTLPFPYKEIFPKERYLADEDNPPKIKINFFENTFNLKNINCYSNEGNKWRKSEINLKKNILEIKIAEKFITERGRINCTLQNKGGWRWLGLQYVIKKIK